MGYPPLTRGFKRNRTEVVICHPRGGDFGSRPWPRSTPFPPTCHQSYQPTWYCPSRTEVWSLILQCLPGWDLCRKSIWRLRLRGLPMEMTLFSISRASGKTQVMAMQMEPEGRIFAVQGGVEPGDVPDRDPSFKWAFQVRCLSSFTKLLLFPVDSVSGGSWL